MVAKWENIAEATERVGTTRQAIWKRINTGRILTWRISPHKVWVYVEDIDRWILERTKRGSN